MVLLFVLVVVLYGILVRSVVFVVVVAEPLIDTVSLPPDDLENVRLTVPLDEYVVVYSK